ncbi:MAG: sigma-70 family RNA polymerase sigma factor [Eubacterium sp.]|nr:sigma-70 family RNA polymerase sigma factor [Eubacterium sp.]
MGKQIYTVDIDRAVRQYADMVYRLAVSNTKVVQDAEDVFQEVFVRLVRYKDKIEDEEHLKAWLIRVTINEARRLADNTWNKNVNLGYTDDESALIPPEEVGNSSPEEEYIASETSDSILKTVQELPQMYREVVHLHYYEDLKISKISDILGINEATVKTRLRRAREMLEKVLKKD